MKNLIGNSGKTLKHILTKEQRAAGLITREDGTNLYLELCTDSIGKTVAVFSTHATIYEIQKEANEYLIRRRNNG
jgi:hypothetical protein